MYDVEIIGFKSRHNIFEKNIYIKMFRLYII